MARSRYDDGGFSGGNMERQALQRLLADIRAGRIDIIVVYKVDRADPRWPILPGWSRSSTHRVSRSSR